MASDLIANDKRAHPRQRARYQRHQSNNPEYPPATHPLSDLSPPRQRFGDGYTIRIFEVATDRHSASQTGNARPERLYQPLKVQRRRFAFNAGIGGDDDFPHTATVVEPGEQWRDAKFIGPDALEWREATPEHMIESGERTGPFDGSNVRCFFHHAEYRWISARAGAERARVGFRQIAAYRTCAHVVRNASERSCKTPDVVRRSLQ
jgi:hypothetical protein